MATGYNVGHVQIAPKTATPTFLDVSGATNLSEDFNQNTEERRADGIIYQTEYGAASLSADLTMISDNFDVRVAANGGVLSSSGTGNTLIERYEQPARYVPAAIIVAEWSPNTDSTREPDVAGIRRTLPNAKAGLIRRSASGQETGFEWTMPLTASPEDDQSPLFILEKLATEPTFTGGVMPVNLTAPPAG